MCNDKTKKVQKVFFFFFDSEFTIVSIADIQHLVGFIITCIISTYQLSLIRTSLKTTLGTSSTTPSFSLIANFNLFGLPTLEQATYNWPCVNI